MATETEAAGAQPAAGATATAEVLSALKFDAGGLVTAIAQQHDSGEVLMVAWMNRDAVAETLATGRVCYWSRSRGKLWRKGETSGQTQTLKEFRWDCDGDTVLLLVDQKGVACHTGRRNCFFNAVRDGHAAVIAEPTVDPEVLYGRMAATAEAAVNRDPSKMTASNRKPTSEPAQFLTAREVAAHLKLSESVLSLWRRKGVGPPWMPISAGRRPQVRYPRAGFERWIAKRTVKPVNEPA